MRNCKQVISMILVLAMLFAVVSVGMVQGAAAGNTIIYQDPPSEPALLGDVNRDGKVDMLDVTALRSSLAYKNNYLDYRNYSENTIEFKVADVYNDFKEEGLAIEKIDMKDITLLRQWIANKKVAQDKGIGEPVYTTATITI